MKIGFSTSVQIEHDSQLKILVLLVFLTGLGYYLATGLGYYLATGLGYYLTTGYYLATGLGYYYKLLSNLYKFQQEEDVAG